MAGRVRTRGDGELAFDDTDVIAETLQRIEAEGGRVTTPRTEIGQGMGAFAAFVDPVGNTFGLYEEPKR